MNILRKNLQMTKQKYFLTASTEISIEVCVKFYRVILCEVNNGVHFSWVFPDITGKNGCCEKVYNNNKDFVMNNDTIH